MRIINSMSKVKVITVGHGVRVFSTNRPSMIFNYRTKFQQKKKKIFWLKNKVKIKI